MRTRRRIRSKRRSIITAMHQRSSGPHVVHRFEPQLGVPWESRAESVRTSFSALLRGPVPPKGWPLGPFFQLSKVSFEIPRRTLALSSLFHVLVFVMPFPAFLESHAEGQRLRERFQLTYYGPIKDLAPLAPPAPAKVKAPRLQSEKAPEPAGVDAYHPRQIVLTQPARITHPRQTLIQPDAPPDAPKVLPDLPNIVQWNSAPALQRPRLQFNAQMRRPQRAVSQTEVAAPEIQNGEHTAAALNIAAAPATIAKPRLELAPSAVPRLSAQNAVGDAGVAPDLGPAQDAGSNSAQNVIALSATPAPPPPQLEIPPGNLAARVSISPGGLQPETPSHDNSAGHGTNGAAGPPGVLITGGDLQNRSNATGNGSAILRDPEKRRLDVSSGARAPGESSADAASAAPTNPSLGNYTPGAPPEVVLGPRRIYTLNVNMPNVNSRSGSWILHFAELGDSRNRRMSAGVAPLERLSPELVAPLPVRKVDPKYPPALMSARVEGDVVLYAIIRRDGNVDSIQLVRGVDPTLDRNAINALAQWKFRPAEKSGSPVELEALVLVPFRAVAPL